MYKKLYKMELYTVQGTCSAVHWGHLMELNMVPSSVGSRHRTHMQWKYFVSAIQNKGVRGGGGRKKNQLLADIKGSIFLKTKCKKYSACPEYFFFVKTSFL